MNLPMDLEPPLRIGTRSSALAIEVATEVARALSRVGLTEGYVLVPIGADRPGGDPSSFAGGPLQTEALRQALQDGLCDIAIHFGKDLPAGCRMKLGAVLPRADPREALCCTGGRSLDQLPAGARIGVPPGVRGPQLLALRDDLQIKTVRGSVESRVAQVRDGQLDGLVLARAIIDHQPLADLDEVFSLATLTPTPAQGLVLVEKARGLSDRIQQLLSAISSHDSLLQLVAERQFKRIMLQFRPAAGATAKSGAAASGGADHQQPVGAVAELNRWAGRVSLTMWGVVIDQGAPLRAEASIILDDDCDHHRHQAEELAERLVVKLQAACSDSSAAVRDSRPVGVMRDRRVLFDSSSPITGGYRQLIAERGGLAVPVPMASTSLALASDVDQVLLSCQQADFVGVSSPLVVEILAEAARRQGTSLDQCLAESTVVAIGAAAGVALAEQYVDFEVAPTAAVGRAALAGVWP
ncbi:MAG: hypothetical protein LBV30_07170, partial [Propionibacteriaceae bacterium]|nr:hypothetical protein [Propionibacteriaceae bacterium]